MHQIVYISTAAPNLEERDVADILDSSARNNQARGVTGFLIYNGQNFLQLLEGPADILETLMAKIHGDPRHGGVVRLESNPVPQPLCQGWAMNRLTLADDANNRKERLQKLLPAGLHEQVRRTILNFSSLN